MDLQLEAKYHKTFTGKPFNEVDHIVNAKGFYLFCKYWKPEGEIKFLIGCIHGFGGHCVRFDGLAHCINSIGGYVYSHDHEYIWELFYAALALCVTLYFFVSQKNSGSKSKEEEHSPTVAKTLLNVYKFAFDELSQEDSGIQEEDSSSSCKTDKSQHDFLFLLTSNLPFVTTFRSFVNIATCICILAVDFHVFPRRFAKVETYGVSVMDLGVGGFIVANALVSPEARNIGNGESEGQRTIVDDYLHLIDDMNQHTEMIKQEYPELPVFLYGQSMGGALATIAVAENPHIYKGFVSLGGMFVKEGPLQYSAMRLMLQVLSYVAPNLQVTSFTEDNTTRDEEETRIAESDPLKSCVIKAGMAFQLIRICERLDETMTSLESPFLALHGGDDVTCAVEGSKVLYRTASSKDKTLKIYDGVLHDVIHELEADRERCFRDILDWLKAHL